VILAEAFVLECTVKKGASKAMGLALIAEKA
jgi:hypothetical protein